VGEVTRVNPTLLKSLVNSGYIPVVATVATDEHGQALNVNADTAAGEVGSKQQLSGRQAAAGDEGTCRT
jgi:acetylglutamate kinase